MPEQPLPEPLARGRCETLATWRDRLYQQFRVPSLLAGLTDLKTAYVDVGNPLLARSVLECVRALPDDLRTDKRLWREIVDAQLPDVALATRVAIPSLSDFVSDPRVLALLLDELTSEHAGAVFAPLLRARCCAALRATIDTSRAARRESSYRRALSRAVPPRLRAMVRNWATRPTIDPLVLAFRAFVATRMHALLRTDAATQPTTVEPAINA